MQTQNPSSYLGFLQMLMHKYIKQDLKPKKHLGFKVKLRVRPIKVQRYSFYLLDPDANKVEDMGLIPASIFYIQME